MSGIANRMSLPTAPIESRPKLFEPSSKKQPDGVDLFAKPKDLASPQVKAKLNLDRNEKPEKEKFDEVLAKAKNHEKDRVPKRKEEPIAKEDSKVSAKQVPTKSNLPKDMPEKPIAVEDVAEDETEIDSPLMRTKVSMKPEVVVESETKQKPMLKFLDSMERELGIEPEKILAAFAALSPMALNATPEVSAQDFVQNLQLPPWKAQRAMDLYSQMLTAVAEKNPMQAMPMNVVPNLNKNGIALDDPNWILQEGSAEDFLAQKDAKDQLSPELRKIMRDQGLQEMNGKFFAKDGQELKNAPFVWNPETKKLELDPKALKELKQDQSLDEISDDRGKNIFFAGATLAAAKESMPKDPSSVTMQQNANAAVMQKPQTVQMMQKMSADSNDGESLHEKGKDKDLKLTEVSGDPNSANFDQIVNAQDHSKIGKEASAAFVGKTDKTAVMVEKEPVPLEDLVKKADVLLHKGGGEMKLKVSTADGLGDLHMKVTVQDGKVDLQLVTENQQTKKALESDVRHLKAALAENQLDLKDIKVDVSQSPSSRMQEQLADQQREHARNFLRDFRDNNSSGRDSMAYASGIRAYQSKTPDEVVRPSAVAERARANGAQRISVVA